MYPFYSLYKQERTLYTFHHNYLTNYQWYEKFNTWSDFDNATRVTIHHRVLLEHVAQEKYSEYFETITQ